MIELLESYVETRIQANEKRKVAEKERRQFFTLGRKEVARFYFNGLFKKGYDHIIHFTISSKLSSMNELFNNVAKQYFEGKV